MISTKGRYALRVMMDLAEQNSDSYIPLKEIAERQGISKKYLEMIVKELVGAKLLIGVSGKGGGYKLSRKPAEYSVGEILTVTEYSVGEILTVTEGTLAVVACLSESAEHCPRAEGCATLPMWSELNQMIHDFFYSKKLTDLVEQK